MSSDPVDRSSTFGWHTSPAGLERQIDGTTLISVEGPAWRDVFVQTFRRNGSQPPFLVPAVAEPLIVWIISGDALTEERDVGGDWSSSPVAAGDFFLTHSPTPYEMKWRSRGDEAFHVMHLYLSIPLFERAAQARFGTDVLPCLREVSGGRDETISRILGLLLAAARRSTEADPMFVEGLAQSLTAHVVRNYAEPGDVRRPAPALPGHKLRSALRYMTEHLSDPFDLAVVSTHVGLSQFHFSRLFKKATGSNPSQYFIRQRISEARRLLRETEYGITEIGMAVGYDSPSHFSQVFRREVGVSPRRYREI